MAISHDTVTGIGCAVALVNTNIDGVETLTDIAALDALLDREQFSGRRDGTAALIPSRGARAAQAERPRRLGLAPARDRGRCSARPPVRRRGRHGTRRPDQGRRAGPPAGLRRGGLHRRPRRPDPEPLAHLLRHRQLRQRNRRRCGHECLLRNVVVELAVNVKSLHGRSARGFNVTAAPSRHLMRPTALSHIGRPLILD